MIFLSDLRFLRPAFRGLCKKIGLKSIFYALDMPKMLKKVDFIIKNGFVLKFLQLANLYIKMNLKFYNK